MKNHTEARTRSFQSADLRIQRLNICNVLKWHLVFNYLVNQAIGLRGSKHQFILSYYSVKFSVFSWFWVTFFFRNIDCVAGNFNYSEIRNRFRHVSFLFIRRVPTIALNTFLATVAGNCNYMASFESSLAKKCYACRSNAVICVNSG